MLVPGRRKVKETKYLNMYKVQNALRQLLSPLQIEPNINSSVMSFGLPTLGWVSLLGSVDDFPFAPSDICLTVDSETSHASEVC